MAKLFVTYGFGSNLRNCYSVVEAETEVAAMYKVHTTCGGDYAFTYREEEFAKQPEEYNLFEVPLQPQVMGVEPIKRPDHD